VYFFSITLVLGAEVVAISALHSANRQDASVGPRPDGFVPQHEVLRDDREPGAATPSSAE
jgi:hypothetical protein